MSAPKGEAPDRVPDEYRWETSLSHMTRVTAEARTRATSEWIVSHMRAERRYSSPPGRGLRRQQLRRVRKSPAGRYYQFLLGHDLP